MRNDKMTDGFAPGFKHEHRRSLHMLHHIVSNHTSMECYTLSCDNRRCVSCIMRPNDNGTIANKIAAWCESPNEHRDVLHLVRRFVNQLRSDDIMSCRLCSTISCYSMSSPTQCHECPFDTVAAFNRMLSNVEQVIKQSESSNE